MKFEINPAIQSAADQIQIQPRTVTILGADGSTVFSQDVYAPTSWDDLAVGIAASKYFDRSIEECSVSKLMHRVADSISDYGWSEGYFTCVQDKWNFNEMLISIMMLQMAAFNSPVYFNVGRKNGMNGLTWATRDGETKQVSSAEAPQCSACFINSVGDSIEEIFELVKTEARLFKYGSGSGSNFSAIRAEGEALSGGGKSSGLMSFLKVLDAGAGAIKSGGTTRRSAKMVCLDVDHPDVEKLIEWKVSEERKAKALVAAGYSGGIAGEAYATVSGQNSNNSIRVSDEFMSAAIEGRQFSLKGRTDCSLDRVVNASELLDKIAKACWECGDPGIQFDDAINRTNPCSEFRINASNPCSEYMFCDDSACNLASLNLKHFVNEKGTIDQDLLRYVIRVIVTAQDIMVSMSGYPTQKIAENSEKYRPIGLGFANLGYVLMRAGIPYESSPAYYKAAEIMKLINHNASIVSVELCDERGQNWREKNGLLNNIVIKNHRNAQLTAIAPTGTIGYLMGCETTGIEPYFSLNTVKTTVDGATMISDYSGVAEGKLKNISNDLLRCAVGENAISPEGHMAMMSAVQPYVSGAISKTINLPNSATVEDIRNTIISAWKDGLKSIAIYRDGCKAYQPLADASQQKHEPTTKPEPKEPSQVKLSSPRNGTTYELGVGQTKVFLRTGEYPDGSLGEIFIDMHKEGTAFRSLMNCFAIAVSVGLQYGVPLEKFVDLFSFVRFEPNGPVRGHGKLKMASSVIDAIFRVLGIDYGEQIDLAQSIEVVDTENIGSAVAHHGDSPICDVCGSLTIRNGTCHKCPNCGTSLGCS